MDRVFSPEQAMRFIKEIDHFETIKLLEEHDNGVVDFEGKHKNHKGDLIVLYAYASNFSMSVYNKKGILHNLSKFWQDYLCQNVEGYPQMLINHIENKIDDDSYRHKKRQINAYSVEDEQEYLARMAESLDRIHEIQVKYGSELNK